MPELSNEIQEKVNGLIDKTRSQCLWFFKPDYYPQSLEETLMVLKKIEINGNRENYINARKFSQWLLQNFKN
ncbi:MAG: hypothetical protein GY941_29380 [Planctomycetes bacterium]|nr:hypothetical protein [Planctomycetota bacterium]